MASIFDTGSYEPQNKVGTIESMLSGVASGFNCNTKRFLFSRRKSYGSWCQQW